MESVGESRNLQSAMRLGGAKDIYYYTAATTSKQSIETVVDTRFKQALNNLRQGSSTFIISVDQGISDILLGVKLPAGLAGTAISYEGLGLPQGWLYQAIARTSIRYAGSSQYFWTGAQTLIECLREMPNPTTRDQLFQLGGAAMVGAALGSGQGDFVGDNLFAYAYLKFPHNSPNGSLMKPNPFPSELLAQPIVVTLELSSLQQLFSSALSGGSVALAPQSFESAYFQVKQVHAKDRGELMMPSPDRSRAYSFPTVAFYQNQIDVPLVQAAGTPNNILLTGFRNGQVRSIVCWVTRDGDERPVTSAPFVKNYNNYILPHDIQLLYNGTVYNDFPGASSQFWNLVSSETPSQINATVLALGSGVCTKVAKVVNWVELPFSQVYEPLSGAHMYVAGKEIMNAVVNMSLTIPVPADGYAGSYTAHFMYVYNCTQMVSGGDCAYVF